MSTDSIDLVCEVNYALGALYYLCNASTKEEILRPEMVSKRYAAAGAVSPMAHISDIKLMRMDTTLDHSQKAEKVVTGSYYGLETNEEPQNVPREEGQRGNSASISAATGISDLEQMLQQKTFTRSEIERLTALLHSRTNESSSAGVVERDGANPCSSPSSLLRLEASSGSVKKHGDERDNLHAAISTPMVTSSVFEEEIASPAELAKTYMGSRPTTKAYLSGIVVRVKKARTE
nr:hypothetical protein [Tanacetum cinerariifolium]